MKVTIEGYKNELMEVTDLTSILRNYQTTISSLLTMHEIPGIPREELVQEQLSKRCLHVSPTSMPASHRWLRERCSADGT